MLIYGIGLDRAGRCVHYHTDNDIAALLCARCHKYYACYRCHDALEDHSFVATTSQIKQPVLCGNCRHMLTRRQYETGRCPYCSHPFNPKCRSHYAVYFGDR